MLRLSGAGPGSGAGARFCLLDPLRCDDRTRRCHEDSADSTRLGGGRRRILPPPKEHAATTRTNKPNPMQGLYEKLRGVGLRTPYVKKYLLPEWWDDDAAASPAGFTEAVWTIARHLGVDAGQLRSQDEPVRLPANNRVHYKLSGDTQHESVALARLLAEQVAKFVMLGAPARPGGAHPDAKTIRAAILEKGAAWVGFGNLLDFTWSLGIPVLHVSELPAGTTKKMDGMAVPIGDRAAIVLTSRRRNPSWMLFLLAHELGHICSGHLDDGSTFVDADIDAASTDPKEKEANDFALALITGNAGTRIVPKARWPKAADLARGALHLGQQIGVDPGHIVLNYAHSMPGNFWGVANAALKLIPSEGDPTAMIRERVSMNLDWSNLPSEAAQFVARMTNQDGNPRP